MATPTNNNLGRNNRSLEEIIIESTSNLGCLLDHMDISIKESEKKPNSTLHIREFYTVYHIETKTTKKGTVEGLQPVGLLCRRYTEFEQLRAYLETIYQWAIVPPLPEKKPLYTWQYVPTDTNDPYYIDRRRVGLENFLHRISAHPVLCRDEIFLGFLQQKEGWQDTLKHTGYLQQVETKLRLVSVQDIKQTTDSRLEDIKTYASGLHSNLDMLLRVRARLANKLCNTHMLHKDYGRTFSEWSVLERDMGDGLQRAGHFFDSIATGISSTVEEEEIVADQLKEYLFFSGALKALCRRWEFHQYEVEAVKKSLRIKTQDIDRIVQGTSSLISRLFGVVESDESRNMKIAQLESKFEDCKQVAQEREAALNEFSQKAVQEYKQFQKRKVDDLKETTANYIAVQIKIAKKGLQTWTNIRDCIDKIP